MISVEQLKDILAPVIAENDLLLVHVTVSPQNRITITIDSARGVTVDDCALVNRYIENQLNRDEEDYHLEVTSPGVDQPLQFKEQYVRNIHRTLKVQLTNGKNTRGILELVEEEGIVLKEAIKTRNRKKNLSDESQEARLIRWDEIQQAKVVVSFK